MTAHYNRASHANPYRTWQHVHYTCDTYTASGTPQTIWAYNGGSCRRAILAYARYINDPITEREPTSDEMRLVVEYCDHYIHAPCLVESDELCQLRSSILYVTTPQELAGWLWGCSILGIAPLGFHALAAEASSSTDRNGGQT